MKKRMLAIVAALSLVFVGAACGSDGAGGNDVAAYQQYMDACAKLEEAGSYTMDAQSNITITVPDEEPMTIDMPMNIKVVGSGTDMKMELVTSTDLGMGVPIDMKMIFIDNMFYMDAMGSKMKVPFSVEDALGQMADAGIPEIDEQFIKDQSIDGDVLKFTLDGAAMTDMVGSQLNDMVASFDAQGSVAYEDIDCEVRLNNGEIANIKMDMGLSMDIEGESMTVQALMDYAITAVGATTVEMPADADEYVETDSSLLF